MYGQELEFMGRNLWLSGNENVGNDFASAFAYANHNKQREFHYSLKWLDKRVYFMVEIVK